MMEIKFRITGKQFNRLREHLFPGDGLEAIAFARCGVLRTKETIALCVRELKTIPYGKCLRNEDRITWPTELILTSIDEIQHNSEILVKIHSHPNNFKNFSAQDTFSDNELSESLEVRLDRIPCFASLIICSDGFLIGRMYLKSKEPISIDSFIVAGDNIQIQKNCVSKELDRNIDLRTIQVFGEGTVNKCKLLKVAVIGCSGTGSIVIEQLARLGIGSLTLLDPDNVEDKNLPRIINAHKQHADHGVPKVNVFKEAITKIGLGTNVEVFINTIFDPEMIKKIAEADIVFGCTDSKEARNVINLLSVHYSIPFIDIGVAIESDGLGGVSQIAGSVHYLQPDGSSLLSRGVFTPEELTSEALRRTQPKEYEERLKIGYIRGTNVDRPAVISVNMLAASLAVNELLARIHDFRDDHNSEFATQRFSLTQTRFISEPEGDPCKLSLKNVGRGDRKPLLGLPFLQ